MDAALKQTEQLLDLLYFEKGLRGKICYIAERYAKANYGYIKVAI